MTITVTIDPTVESVGIQTINVALGKTGRTDVEAKADLAAYLRTIVAKLYVQGDQMKRSTAADASAVSAAASYISAT